jgi:hypothetical protein
MTFRIPLARAASFALGAVLASSSLAAAAAPAKAPVRLGFATGDDWEPAVATDASNHVYAAWSHYTNYGGNGSGEPDPTCPECASPHTVIQISADGGTTWGQPRTLVHTTTRQDDPQIEVDPADGKTVYASFMQDNKGSIYVGRSDDFGQTWRTVLVEPLQRGTDKDILAVRGGDVYVVYHTQQKIFASVSHDGGATWSFNNLVGTTNSTLGQSLPSGGAIDSHGNAYFAWNGVTQSGQAKGPINLFVTRSTDGGHSWTTSLIDVSQAPPPCGCGGWDFWGAQMALAIDSSDKIYVLWNANRVKYAPQRAYFESSIDGGAHWSDPLDISLAPAGTNHAFPALVAGAAGDIRIAWMDDRNGFDAGGNDPNARWNTYDRRSTNGGATWSTEAKLSAFVAGFTYKLATPRDGFLQPYGDYFEIDIDNLGRTVALWGEGNSYAGPGNVWFTRR